MGGGEKTDEASKTMKGTVKMATGYLAWGLWHIFNAEVAAGWCCLPGRGLGCLSPGQQREGSKCLEDVG